jgi:hypothetical protein
MLEIEWFANGNTCFLFITLLAARAADVRGRAIKDTLPPKSPTPSWSDLINKYEKCQYKTPHQLNYRAHNKVLLNAQKS